jgi:hypothetical protein
VKIKLENLRQIIREEINIQRINQPYQNSLDDDEAYNEDSVYVPNDIKKKIRVWMKSMKLIP